MSELTNELGRDERIAAENMLYSDMFHRETGVKWIALGVAFVIHVIVVMINFPEVKQFIEPKKTNAIVVKKYVPPPPKVERRVIEKKKFTKKVPVPDPTPDEPEPIREPEPEIDPEPLPPDVEFLIGVPDAPPPTGPLLPGSGGVTNPVLIAESKVDPSYPELARVARLEGRVILQAIIQKDGAVGSVEVLSCNKPNLGFEESAAQAVREWRYQPAMQGDRPVDVYFTVRVDFELQ